MLALGSSYSPLMVKADTDSILIQQKNVLLFFLAFSLTLQGKSNCPSLLTKCGSPLREGGLLTFLDQLQLAEDEELVHIISERLTEHF